MDELADRWTAAGMSAAAIAQLEVSKRVARIGNRFEQEMKAELTAIGLTYAEFDVLAALSRGGPPFRLRPSELSRSLFLTSGGTSNVLQRLTNNGYVIREVDENDARSRWVRLTKNGQTVADNAMAASMRVHEDLLGNLPEDKLRKAADALREVLTELNKRRR